MALVIVAPAAVALSRKLVTPPKGVGDPVDMPSLRLTIVAPPAVELSSKLVTPPMPPSKNVGPLVMSTLLPAVALLRKTSSPAWSRLTSPEMKIDCVWAELFAIPRRKSGTRRRD